MTTRRSPILGALIWTEECNQELRDLYANGRSNKELAELTGRTVHAIERRKHLLGLHGGSPTCRRCGVPLEQGGAHRPANYCSRECERWGFYEATVGHQPMVEIKGVCAHCRKPFARIVKPTGRGQKESGLAAYCSRDCDKAAWYQRMKAGPAGPAFMRSRNKRTGIIQEARKGGSGTSSACTTSSLSPLDVGRGSAGHADVFEWCHTQGNRGGLRAKCCGC